MHFIKKVFFAGMRVYPGRLSFLPVEPYVPPSNLNSTFKRPALTHSQSEYNHRTAAGAGAGAMESFAEPRPPPRSQSVYEVEQVLREKLREEEEARRARGGSSPGSDERFSPGSMGDHRPEWSGSSNGFEDLERVTTIDMNGHRENGRIDPPLNGNAFAAGDRDRVGDASPKREIPTPLLPPLNEPVPADWVTIEDDFVLLGASYQSHLGHDYCAHPDSTINDELIYLAFVRNAPSGVRKSLLSMFTKTQDGSQVNVPGYEVVKVKAFRLEPLTDQGILCVDGEQVDYGPIQAQVLPGIARVMARPKY